MSSIVVQNQQNSSIKFNVFCILIEHSEYGFFNFWHINYSIIIVLLNYKRVRWNSLLCISCFRTRNSIIQSLVLFSIIQSQEEIGKTSKNWENPYNNILMYDVKWTINFSILLCFQLFSGSIFSLSHNMCDMVQWRRHITWLSLTTAAWKPTIFKGKQTILCEIYLSE